MKSVFEDLKNEERKIERSRIEELIRSENGENFIKQGGRQKFENVGENEGSGYIMKIGKRVRI